MRDTFVIFKSSYDAMKKLSPEDAYKVFTAMCEYSFNDNVIELDGVSEIVFDLIKPIIDNSNKRYDASVENGKKGGRPKKPDNNLNKPIDNLIKPNIILKEEPNTNLNKNKNKNDNKNKNENKNEDMNKNENIESEIKDLMRWKHMTYDEAVNYIKGLPPIKEKQVENKVKTIFDDLLPF